MMVSVFINASYLEQCASQTFLFYDIPFEKKRLRHPWMGSLHVNDMKTTNLPLQTLPKLKKIFFGKMRGIK